MAAVLAACSDPPDPPRVAAPGGSTAPYVLWKAASDPVRGPVALVVDEPGGPVDRIVADSDVTTFLNDRFHPVFARSDAEQPSGTVAFYDGCGCRLAGPLTPPDPAAFIAVANDVIVRPEAHRCEGGPFRRGCMPP